MLPQAASSEERQNRLIVDTIVTFIDEHTGRKLVYKLLGTLKHRAQDGRMHVTNVYDNLKTLLMKIKETPTPGVPCLIQGVYDNHYTGIRIEFIGSMYKVYILDPAEGQALYSLLPLETIQSIKRIFGVRTIHRAVACQRDASDTFCQTWSLVLFSNTEFQTDDGLNFVLDLYKKIVRSSEFLNWLSGRYIIMPTTIYKIIGWDKGQFVSVVP